MDHMIAKIKMAARNGILIDSSLDFIRRRIPKMSVIANPRISDMLYRDKLMKNLRREYDKKAYYINNYEKGKPDSNQIYILWLQGENQAPPLVKACIHSVRMNLKDFNVLVLDEKNVFDYVSLPDYIIDKWRGKKMSNIHFSDIIRTNLLLKSGGTWIDATVFISKYPQVDAMLNSELFVFKDLHDPTTVLSSWFIHSNKGNDILNATQNMLFAYWKKNDKLVNYFLYHFFFTLAAKHFKEQWESVPPFSNEPPFILLKELEKPYDPERFKDILSVSDIHKLTYKLESPQYNHGRLTNYGHILEDYLKGTRV